MHVRYHAPNTLHTQEVNARATGRVGPARHRCEFRKASMQTFNGVSAAALPPLRWQKSRRSNPSGNCVEMAKLPGGAGIAVRNSRDPDGPALIYTVDEIAAFIHGANDGDFDNLIQ